MSAKLRSGPDNTTSVGARMTPDKPSSIPKPACLQAAIPPSKAETFWYPISLSVAAANTAFCPLLQVTAIEAALSGANSAI